MLYNIISHAWSHWMLIIVNEWASVIIPILQREDRIYPRSQSNGQRQDFSLDLLTSEAVPHEEPLLPIGIWAKIKGWETSSKLDSNTRFCGTDYKIHIEIQKREKFLGPRLSYKWLRAAPWSKYGRELVEHRGKAKPCSSWGRLSSLTERRGRRLGGWAFRSSLLGTA